jgi:hypothetical protein
LKQTTVAKIILKNLIRLGFIKKSGNFSMREM